MVVSFIESEFQTKVDYESWLATTNKRKAPESDAEAAKVIAAALRTAR